jgi:hypothetical protein
LPGIPPGSANLTLGLLQGSPVIRPESLEGVHGTVVCANHHEATRPGNRRRNGSGKAAGKDGQEENGNQMSKDEGGWNSSFSEKPVRPCVRRLVDWINLTDSQDLLWHPGSVNLRESRVHYVALPIMWRQARKALM